MNAGAARLRPWLLVIGLTALPAGVGAAEPAAKPVHFNTAFDSGSLGRIDRLGEDEFRLHVAGQQDSRGRNRQATWFYFRMDDVAGRVLTLRFCDFKGEYNDQPARAPVGASYRPWYSDDGEHWTHFAETAWDAAKDEATVTLRPRGDTVWVAHVPPYPLARLSRLLDEIGRSPAARVETIGRSVLGRDLELLTVTNPEQPDLAKKTVWFIARQHPWETGTSFVMEGALRYAISDEPAARRLRDETIFQFVPMMNPDGVARGDVRFNANGYDTNRQWDLVDLRDRQWLQKMPEIWYVKSAVLARHARRPIDLLFNLHTNESNEYMETMVDADPAQAMLHRLFAACASRTGFDPSRPKLTLFAAGPANTTLSLWPEARVPAVLMERRITRSPKLGRIATTDDHLAFGRQLIAMLAEAVR